jgi:hypothetical protein
MTDSASNIKIAALLFLCLFLAQPLFATEWYVWSGASGNNDGGPDEGWTNAWESFADITWSTGGVIAGDTLYISGGSSGITYNETLSIAVSGSDGSPVTIKTGAQSPSPAGHGGVVTIDGDTYGINLSGRNYVEIDGSDGAYNINLKTTGNTHSGFRIYNHYVGIIIKYAEAYNNGTYGFYSEANGSSCHAAGDPYSALIIDHCYTHDNGEDGITGGNCMTVRYSRISATHASHHDGWEAYGGSSFGHIKGYGNSFEGSGANCQFGGNPLSGEGPLYLYNNTFQCNDQIDGFLGCEYERAIRFGPESESSGIEVYIWNNTFAFTPYDAAVNLDGHGGDYDVIDVRNNLFYNCGLTGQPVISIPTISGSVVVDYNIIHTDDGSFPGTTMSIEGSSYSCSEGAYSTYNTNGSCNSFSFDSSPVEGTRDGGNLPPGTQPGKRQPPPGTHRESVAGCWNGK